jgi:hypothetical protein
MVDSRKAVEGGGRTIGQEVKLGSRFPRPFGLRNEVEGEIGPGHEPALDGESPALLPQLAASRESVLGSGTDRFETREHLAIVVRAELRSSRIELAFGPMEPLAGARGDLRRGLFEKMRLEKKEIEGFVSRSVSPGRSLLDLALQILAKRGEGLSRVGGGRGEVGRILEPRKSVIEKVDRSLAFAKGSLRPGPWRRSEGSFCLLEESGGCAKPFGGVAISFSAGSEIPEEKGEHAEDRFSRVERGIELVEAAGPELPGFDLEMAAGELAVDLLSGRQLLRGKGVELRKQ